MIRWPIPTSLLLLTACPDAEVDGEPAGDSMATTTGEDEGSTSLTPPGDGESTDDGTSTAAADTDVTDTGTGDTGDTADTGTSDTGTDAITTGSVACAEDCSELDDACNIGVCDEGTCVADPMPDDSKCDDGLFCTEGDVCTAGVCGGTPLECPSDNPCEVGVCDEDADACDLEAFGDDMPCDDADPCTGDGTCAAGDCTPGPDLCPALDTECSVGVCTPGVGCEAEPANEGGACDITNACAQSECMAGACVPVATTNEGLPCEDGEFCTFGDTCQAGACVPGVAAACPEDDLCGTWACDEVADACLLTPQNEGMACDDGNQCTASSECVMGACEEAAGGPMVTYLWEDFSDNSAGWALGPEWEIGPASTSVGGFPGSDPGTDHTPTADNGVAGVVLGGLASTALHPYYYLTSPPMSVPPGEAAILGFYRWLNSDYHPYMHNSIEVWDGASWVLIWVSGGPPAINDTAWTYIEHDLSSYANDAMRVRFGFDVGNIGVYDAPSWNIDDVLVSGIACP